MIMDLRIDDLVTLDGKQFVILDIIEFAGKKYTFVNNVENNNPTNAFGVYLVEDNNFKKVIDDNMINSLIPIFEEDISKRVEKYIEENGEENV